MHISEVKRTEEEKDSDDDDREEKDGEEVRECKGKRLKRRGEGERRGR